MNLKTVLIPEVIRGSRSSGSKPLDQTFKLSLESLQFTPQGVTISHSNPLIAGAILKSPEARSAFTQAKRHWLEKSDVYYLTKDFGQALANMRDREVVGDLLPDLSIYVHFADLFPNIQGAYLYIGTADEKTPVKVENRGHRLVWISYFGPFDRARHACYLGRCNFFLPNHSQQTVADIVASYEQNAQDADALERMRLAKLLLNVALYLRSEDREILDLTPVGLKSLKARKTAARDTKGCSNLTSLKIKLINFDYRRLNLRDEKEVFVDSFPRWQRCGPGLEQLKLVWVREHKRTYNKKETAHDCCRHS